MITRHLVGKIAKVEGRKVGGQHVSNDREIKVV